MKRKKHLQNISIEMIKELFTEMFQAQEEKLFLLPTQVQLQDQIDCQKKIQNNNKTLEKLSKEIADLKISLETSQEIFEKKFQKVDGNLGKQKQKHKENIKKLWKDNNQLCERLRDPEDRSRCDNLSIDGMAEVENETWEETEEILQNLFEEKLQLENILVEKAHRAGNKEKNNKRTIVVKLGSLKGKLKIISEARKLKGANISINEHYSKETL